MMSRAVQRAIFATTAAVLVAGAAAPAYADGKLDANYTISLAGISIGKSDWTVDIKDDKFTTQASGRASGMLSVLVKGEGSVNVSGAVAAGKLVPNLFTSKVNRDDEKSEFRMVFDGGNVKELVAGEPPKSDDRVAVTEEHRKGVIDPISAMLVPVAGTGDVLSAEACQRSLPVFDGRRRFDLKLSFKRMDKVKADKGYEGPAVVCSVTFQALAGHRASSTLVKYLSEGRDMELWLAPIAGTRVLAPFRFSIANMIGNLVLQATTFQTSGPKPTTTGAKAN